MKNVLEDIRQVSESKEHNIQVIGFGRRFVALVVDGLIVFFVSFILALLLGMVDVFFGGGVLPWNLIIVAIMFLFSLFYFTGQWVRSSGQTLGKLLLNIKIVDMTGEPLSAGKMYLRFLGYLLSGVVASLGFVWVAIDKKRRGWHDLIAKTYVIHLRDDIPVGGEVTFTASDEGKGWIWVVLWLLLAIGAPSVVFAGLWFLGPIVSGFLSGLR
jgi:uncharacterized RDD family membrane protein YckC